MRELQEAEVLINGKPLTQPQSRSVRLALLLIQGDLCSLSNVLHLHAHIERIQEVLAIMDETEEVSL